MPARFPFSLLLLLSALVLAPRWAEASLRLPAIFGSNMVLQSGPSTPVWGWAAPGAKVEIRLGRTSATATADATGKWRATLMDLRETSAPLTMTVSSGTSTISYSNVLIGEVWVGSGQSNMEWGVAGALQPQKEIASANFPTIRLFKVPKITSGQPRTDLGWEQDGEWLSGAHRGERKPDDIIGQWVECTPASVGRFSAVMYFFGRELQQKTGKPIGLLESCVSGTHIEGWLPKEALTKGPALRDLVLNVEHAERSYRSALPAKLTELEAWVAAARAAIGRGEAVPSGPKGVTLKATATNADGAALLEQLAEADRWIAGARTALKDNSAIPEVPLGLPQVPGSVGGNYLFNGMIAPLMPLGIRGVLWYQGENNGGEGESYHIKLKALIETWRELWGRGEFPFYLVQLPQFEKAKDDPAGGDGWSKLREAQRKTLTVPNTGMAVAIDIGDPNDIHPSNKQEVAHRLARWALRQVYGQKDVAPSGPLFKSMKVEGGKIRVNFDHVGSGLMAGKKRPLETATESKSAALKRFAVAGADRHWHWAEASIDGETVLVSSPQVPAPVAVRYAYSHHPEGANLYNRDGLPTSPFRTDDW